MSRSKAGRRLARKGSPGQAALGPHPAAVGNQAEAHKQAPVMPGNSLDSLRVLGWGPEGYLRLQPLPDELGEQGPEREGASQGHTVSYGWSDQVSHVLTPASVVSTKPLIFFLAVKLRGLGRSQETQGATEVQRRTGERETRPPSAPSGACPAAQRTAGN